MIYLDNKKILVLLHGYNSTIINKSDETVVDAAFYSVSIYKVYHNSPIKIIPESLIHNFAGIEGFYKKEYQQYLYKTHINSKFIADTKALAVHLPESEKTLIAVEQGAQLISENPAEGQLSIGTRIDSG